MNQSDDLKLVYRRFNTLCESYNENQDMLTALALDEVVGHLKQATTVMPNATAFHDLLDSLTRTISHNDMAAFHRLQEAIRNAAEEYDLA